MMNDNEGLCSLPLEVDDDFITAQGSFPQPSNRTSIMVGFVAVSKLFKIMSEVLFRHRCCLNRFNLSNQWENDPPPGDPTSTAAPMSMDEIIRRESTWIVRAHDRIREVLDGLPPDLATQRAEVATNPDLPPDMSAIFGMQVANCLITAASVQFALVSQCAGTPYGSNLTFKSFSSMISRRSSMRVPIRSPNRRSRRPGRCTDCCPVFHSITWQPTERAW
jgi:hypothetical protein